MSNPVMSNPANLQQLASEASTALRQGQAQVAQDKFQLLLQQPQCQNNAQLWLGLAYAAGNLKNNDEALKAVNQALTFQPQNLHALLFKADHLWHNGDPRTAAEFYQGFLQIAEQETQLPQDLAAQVTRAQTNYDSIANQQLDFLRDKIEKLGLNNTNNSPRLLEGLAISLGEKQFYPQQPSKFFFPQLPHIQFFEPQSFEWVKPLESHSQTIKQELREAIDKSVGFEPYLQSSDEVPTLSPSSNWDNDDWGAFYLWKNGELQADAETHFPKTLAALAAVPFAQIEGNSPNVLFSRLRPGTRIAPHCGFLNTRLICHLPIIVPENCGALRCGNEARPWHEGEIMIFDDSIEHEAWNDSDEERIVLIFEIWRPELNQEERHGVAEILKAIKSYTPEDS